MSNQDERRDASLFPFAAAQEYWLDAWQRGILFMDVLRQRGNNYFDHNARKAPHVLTLVQSLCLTAAP
jgi:hypothetical protein